MVKFAFLLAFGIFGLSCSAQGENLYYPEEAWRAAIGPDGMQRINIRCGPDFFDPPHVIVKANVPVELSVSTTRGLPSHNFLVNLSGPNAINATNANSPIGSAQKSFVFVPGLPGDYTMVCRNNAGVANAPTEKSMQGVLTVIP